jgi:hypothetical protein
MKISSPLLSSPSPYDSQAKVASSTNHSRSGHLLINGQRYIELNGEQVLLTAENFLPMVQDTFHAVLNQEGMERLPQLVDRFTNHETEHLDFRPNDPDHYFDKKTGEYFCSLFGAQGDFLYHTTHGGKNRILTSTHSVASREDLTQAPQTNATTTFLAWLDKYEKRGHEEFPIVARDLIDGRPASITRQ